MLATVLSFLFSQELVCCIRSEDTQKDILWNSLYHPYHPVPTLQNTRLTSRNVYIAFQEIKSNLFLLGRAETKPFVLYSFKMPSHPRRVPLCLAAREFAAGALPWTSDGPRLLRVNMWSNQSGLAFSRNVTAPAPSADRTICNLMLGTIAYVPLTAVCLQAHSDRRPEPLLPLQFRKMSPRCLSFYCRIGVYLWPSLLLTLVERLTSALSNITLDSLFGHAA